MDKLTVSQNRCWICFSNENQTNLTDVNSEKILKSFRTYLETSMEALENETQASCCSYCSESANQVILLEEQIEKLGKEISELSSLFLTNVLERRKHFSKEKNDNFHKSTPPKCKCVTVDESCDHLSSLLCKNSVVQKEIFEGGTKVLSSNCQEKTEKYDRINDLGFDAGDDEKTFPTEDEIEVKYSYDETVTKGNGIVDKQIEPSPGMSGTIVPDCQPTLKTALADLLKHFKTPTVRLERLQSWKSRKPKIVVDNAYSNTAFESSDRDCFSGPKMNNGLNSNENISHLTVLPTNQQNSFSVYTPSLNTSVIGEKEVLKCERNTDGNKPYKCSICGQAFLKLCDSEDHEKLHNDGHHYQSSIRHKSSLNPSRLKLHETLKLHFNSSVSSKSGRTSDSEETAFKCSICAKSFKNGALLKRHKIFHSEDKPFKCSFCSKSYVYPSDVKKHEMIHTGERPYKCSLCPKSFRTTRNLKNHETVHTGEKPHKCSSCPKSFTSASSLRKHKTVHTEKRLYKCSFCPKLFGSSQYLKNHEAVHTGEGAYKCSFCSKSFSIERYLKSHEKVHTGEKPYKCSFCSTSFSSELGLKNHETVHTGGTSYKCSLCSKSFRSAALLKRHQVVHSQNKPFKCSFCSKSFCFSNEVKIHEIIHTGERPFKCSFCLLSFKRACHLKNHETIHTGRKLLKCYLCSKSFKKELSLKRHEKMHTGERPFKCSSCEMTYKRKEHLKLHRARVHENIKEEFILP